MGKNLLLGLEASKHLCLLPCGPMQTSAPEALLYFTYVGLLESRLLKFGAALS